MTATTHNKCTFQVAFTPALGFICYGPLLPLVLLCCSDPASSALHGEARHITRARAALSGPDVFQINTSQMNKRNNTCFQSRSTMQLGPATLHNNNRIHWTKQTGSKTMTMEGASLTDGIIVLMNVQYLL